MGQNTDHALDVALPAMQAGKQVFALWLNTSVHHDTQSSSPLGTWVMGLHHGAALCVAFRTAVCRSGFRLYSPVFFGLVEFSTLFLSVHNVLKDKRAHYPKLFVGVRMGFAVSFLVLRIGALVPRYWDVASLCYWYIWYHPPGWFQWLTIGSITAFSLLMVLQVWWAILVLKGVVQVVVGAAAAGTRRRLRQQGNETATTSQRNDDNDDHPVTKRKNT